MRRIMTSMKACSIAALASRLRASPLLTAVELDAADWKIWPVNLDQAWRITVKHGQTRSELVEHGPQLG